MDEAPTRPAPPLARAVFRGAMVMVALRFSMRAIGFVSVLVTARLLTPADFGVIGTAAIVTGFFAVLQQLGIGEALTRLPRLETGHLETAWTLNLLASALIGAGLFAASAPAAALLGEPQLTDALRVMAFGQLITALGSPGAMLLLRNMDFRREFQLRVTQKLLLAACTVAGALLLRNWWGLVWGMMAGAVLGCAATYVFCPARPALRLDRAGDFLSFSFWTFVQALAVYVAMVADELAVRRVTDTATFGLYHTSRDLSRVLVSEAVAPASAALLPGLARLQGEPDRFARASAQAVGAGAIVGIAFGLGVSATAPEVVGLLLGPKWAAAAPFLALAAIGNIGQTLAGLHRGILAALGKARWSALLWILRAAVLVPLCLVAAWLGGPMAAAAAFAVASVALAVLDYALIFRTLRRPRALLDIFARPAAAGGAMTLAIALLPLPPDTPLLLSAAAKVAVGGFAYGFALLALWWVSGRPEGAETVLIERLPARIARLLLPAGARPALGGQA